MNAETVWGERVQALTENTDTSPEWEDLARRLREAMERQPQRWRKIQTHRGAGLIASAPPDTALVLLESWVKAAGPKARPVMDAIATEKTTLIRLLFLARLALLRRVLDPARREMLNANER